MPRVGNQAFANLVDSRVTSFTHINNKGDYVPIIPGRFLGFRHPGGEVVKIAQRMVALSTKFPISSMDRSLIMVAHLRESR
ncbi:hypothetical protein ONZ45_g4799 [Pleurotus djamor]|nr:hypothetical protein ONZ45_g4799 [Pleurotus djamor]